MILSVPVTKNYRGKITFELYSSADALILTAVGVQNGVFFEAEIADQPIGYYYAVAWHPSGDLIGYGDAYSDGVSLKSTHELYSDLYMQLFFTLPIVKRSKGGEFVMNLGLERGVTKHSIGASKTTRSYYDVSLLYKGVNESQRKIIEDFYNRVSMFTLTHSDDVDYAVQPKSYQETGKTDNHHDIVIKGVAERGV